MSTATRPRRPRPLPQNIPHTVMVDDQRMTPRWLSVYEARNAVRGWRREGETVQTYRTTDRDGTDTLVAYVRTAPGRWDGVDHMVLIYEFPVESLLDL